jgi:hypothetical protein
MVRARSPSWLDGKFASFSGAVDAVATAVAVEAVAVLEGEAVAVLPTDASPAEPFPHPLASRTPPAAARPAAVTRSRPVRVIRLISLQRQARIADDGNG